MRMPLLFISATLRRGTLPWLGADVCGQASEAALRDAASGGNTAQVVELITKGHVKDVDAPNAAGWTALHLAAVRNCLVHDAANLLTN